VCLLAAMDELVALKLRIVTALQSAISRKWHALAVSPSDHGELMRSARHRAIV
jgi:stress-induced morphogen